MPRKQFVADLRAATEKGDIGIISGVRSGDDDGEIHFEVAPSTFNGLKFTLAAVLNDVSEYPDAHTFSVFAVDDVPVSVAKPLDKLPMIPGQTVAQLLDVVSTAIGKLRTGDGDDDDGDDGDDGDPDMNSGAESDTTDEEQPFFDDEQPFVSVRKSNEVANPGNRFKSRSNKLVEWQKLLYQDLTAAKKAGFRIGVFGGAVRLKEPCYISISCRIEKLGLSEDSMRAWKVHPKEYLVLLLKFPNGYRRLVEVQGKGPPTSIDLVEFRVGIDRTNYKPSCNEVVSAFENVAVDEEALVHSNPSRNDFRLCFISQPLADLFNTRFAQLLMFRLHGMSWDGAELFFNDTQGKGNVANELSDPKYHHTPDSGDSTYPDIVTGDQFKIDNDPSKLSLPLVAMQFLMRHFVQCTEFCLVCHKKLQADLEAIKPYVCDSSLCLYQLMSLGFGTSMEHEIVEQPYVVDILISFLYSSVRSSPSTSIRDMVCGGNSEPSNTHTYPVGLELKIPPSGVHVETSWEHLERCQSHGIKMGGTQNQNQALSASGSTKDHTMIPYKIRFNEKMRTLYFDPESGIHNSTKCPIKRGDWVAIQAPQDRNRIFHHRITAVDFPSAQLAAPVVMPINPVAQTKRHDRSQATVPTGSRASTSYVSAIGRNDNKEDVKAFMYVYNCNFDSLSFPEKQGAIRFLIDMMPTVLEMKEFLTKTAQTTSLASWSDRMPPACVGLLRWIIASCRSCIMQVDGIISKGKTADGRGKIIPGTDRVDGLPSTYVQFRIAMGAPDKERRFLESVVKSAPNRKYPSLFAFHGSRMWNWHSIIREGLHYRKEENGRVYGHGVYLSLNPSTSIGYTKYLGGHTWRNSVLNPTSAMCLSEVVNAPKQFVSTTPHLVVNQVEWIQTRYLFVECDSYDLSRQSSRAESHGLYYEQDPAVCARGLDITSQTPTEPLHIPLSAVSAVKKLKSQDGSIKEQFNSSKRPAVEERNKEHSKKRKFTAEDDDFESVATDEEDKALLVWESDDAGLDSREPTDDEDCSTADEPFWSNPGSPARRKPSSLFKRTAHGPPQTDFVPGSLDTSKLPLLALPSYATSMATKRLQQDLKDLIRVQNNTALHDLGFYLNPDLVNSVYQWIVELHSFDAELPLAQDMKAAKVTSIVLELRFGPDYPMAPPFVRVIQPRFLPFANGGGGHVTAGGALCMELLTNSGWSAVYSIEHVLFQVRMALVDPEPRPARLALLPSNVVTPNAAKYGMGEAVEAFRRACQMHGWQVPKGLEAIMKVAPENTG